MLSAISFVYSVITCYYFYGIAFILLAYVGGKDYTKSQYDRVTKAVRPLGSAFKPFVYATAVEKGLGPNDILDDTPFKAGDWKPKNYGNKYRGKIPAYKALMVSSNVCAARLIESTGVRSVIQMARVLGLTTPFEYDYTIALGSNGVKLYDMVVAYGAFANGGYRTIFRTPNPAHRITATVSEDDFDFILNGQHDGIAGYLYAFAHLNGVYTGYGYTLTSLATCDDERIIVAVKAYAESVQNELHDLISVVEFIFNFIDKVFD